MQDDEKKSVEDELIDDDMDFGDFDDDFEDDLDVDLGEDVADLGVDDWDDVDAEESLDVDPASFGDAPPKDSFVKKNFNLIVIAIAVLGGGGFVLAQMGGAPALTPVDQVADNSEVVDVDMGDMPPAPASVDATALSVDSTDLAVDSNVPSVEDIDESGLTPLPTFGDEQPELVPLDFLGEETANAVVEEAVSELPAELTAAAPTQDGGDVFEADLELVVDDPLVDLSVDSVPENEPFEDLTTLPVSEEETFSEPVIEDVPMVDAVDENAALVETLRMDIDAKDAVIADTNAQVSALEDTVNALKAELEAVKASLDEERASQQRALENVQAAAAPDLSASVVEDLPVKAVTPPAKKPVVKAEAKAKAPTVLYQWILRAAQPGKAMIFNSNTQDVLNVEHGDVVPGIGAVHSISVQDGLWVVEGEKGRITQ